MVCIRPVEPYSTFLPEKYSLTTLATSAKNQDCLNAKRESLNIIQQAVLEVKIKEFETHLNLLYIKA